MEHQIIPGAQPHRKSGAGDGESPGYRFYLGVEYVEFIKPIRQGRGPEILELFKYPGRRRPFNIGPDTKPDFSAIWS
jgi:hypothetical protein